MNLNSTLNACKWPLCIILDITAVDGVLFCMIKADSLQHFFSNPQKSEKLEMGGK